MNLQSNALTSSFISGELFDLEEELFDLEEELFVLAADPGRPAVLTADLGRPAVDPGNADMGRRTVLGVADD